MRLSKIRQKKFQPKGFTLVEVLVTVSISSIIILAMLSLYVAGQRYFMNGNARSDLLRDNRQVFNFVSRDVQEAIQVMPSWDIYATSTDCLVLQVPSIDSNRLIIDIDSQFDYIVYRLNSESPNKLERVIDANNGVSNREDSSRTIATRVNSFQLSSGGVELSSVSDFSQVASVDITLVTTQNLLGRTFQENLKTGVKLRNKSN